MKTTPLTLVLSGLLLSAHFLTAEPKVMHVAESKAVPMDRHHRLFLGAKLQVKDESGWHEITGVEKGWFVAEKEGIAIRIPMDRPGFEFRFNRELKLSSTEVEIADFSAEADFSPLQDPRRRWLESQALAINSAGDEVNAASRRLGGQIAAAAAQQRLLDGLDPNAPASVAEDIVGGAVADVEGAMADLADASFAAGSEQYDPAYYSRKEHATEGEEGSGHDALRVAGKLHTEVALARPYVLVYVEFTVPDEVARLRRTFAEPLPAMQAGETKSFSFLKTGFPAGYELGEVQLHYFDQGREISTPEAERRILLTQEEALQFAVLDHVSRHRDRGEAGDAELVEELVDAELRAAWIRQGRDCYVQVDPDGHASGIFRDAEAAHPLTNAPLLALVQQMGFRPAVTAEGEAISGMLALKAGPL